MRNRRFSRRNRKMESRLSSMPIRRRKLREDFEDNDIVSYSDLTPEQKKQAIELAREDRSLLYMFSEEITEEYGWRLDELCEEYTNKTKIEVNKKEIQWQCSSQGPYPERWDAFETFEKYYPTFGDFEFEIQPVGMFDDDANVWVSVDNPYMIVSDDYYPETWWYEGSRNRDSLLHMDIDEDDKREFLACAGEYAREVERYIEMVYEATQKFLYDVWELINDTCTAYPDDDWFEYMLDANNYEFEVNEFGDVVDFSL